ncbi:putative MFS family arabinose efflux permease [Streptomyces sp. 3211.6]|uniref:MFS transporter n=1 Tax=Streptomyces sp. 3211.6 TaxID=1938845 RepID=UPI000F22DDF0|nr:MFS transporter [Streptomyces sp. 3211.6]RKT07839.1 putative MFS family arabinose efflux permease [Streptomyces sp. 3211.6]
MALPTARTAREPVPPKPARLPLGFLTPIVLGTMLNALNSSMLAVALLSIQKAYDAGAAVVWLVSGLYLATAVAQPTMGRLADAFGPRRIFGIGLLLVLGSAAAAPFAPTLGWLIAARVVLGIGTSAAYPAGMSMIRLRADSGPAAAGAPAGGLGAISAASQAAVALGPPLGGVLVQLVDWRAIFWVNVPIALAAMVMALLWLPADDPARRASVTLRELDLPGMALFTGELCGLMLFLLSLPDHPRWWALAVFVVLTAVLIWRELRAHRPFVDLRMIARNRPLAATYVRCMATYVVFYSITYALPQWLQQGRGLSESESGLVMLPVAILGIVTTMWATRLVGRGLRTVLITGSGALCLGSAALALFGSSVPIWQILVIAAVLGLPNGFNSLGNQTLMYRTAPAEQIGTASGLLRTSQYIGANLASALVGIALGRQAGDSGLHLLAAVITGISLVLLLNAATTRHLRGAAARG